MSDGNDHCQHCGDEVCTIPGMDNFVEVTHYGTTEFAEMYYCDEVCLADDLAECPDTGGEPADE